MTSWVPSLFPVRARRAVPFSEVHFRATARLVTTPPCRTTFRLFTLPVYKRKPAEFSCLELVFLRTKFPLHSVRLLFRFLCKPVSSDNPDVRFVGCIPLWQKTLTYFKMLLVSFLALLISFAFHFFGLEQSTRRGTVSFP